MDLWYMYMWTELHKTFLIEFLLKGGQLPSKEKECTRSSKIGVELTSKQYYNTSWTKVFLSMNNLRVLVLQKKKKKATLTIKEQLHIVIFLLI